MLELIWFWLVALMFTAWSVLDGFDLGAGVLHRWVARTDSERREVFASIGPVWDGNEVWLIAAGGSTMAAFPRLLASGFSGLYLPVIFVAWALILRGISIELRSHVGNPLWRAFFDSTFVLGSAAVPFLMGAALGNVLRGVPLQPDGFFELELFGTEGRAGVLDGFTVLCGALVLITVSAHGANWLVWKTSGPVHERARLARRWLWPSALALAVSTTGALFQLAPERFTQFASRPWLWGVALIAVVGGLLPSLRPADERAPFFGGATFIAGLLILAVGSLYPVVLPALGNPAASLTVRTAASAERALTAGLAWWGPGVLLAALYLWWVLRHFRGKVAVQSGE